MSNIKIRKLITKQDLQAVIDLIEETIVKYITDLEYVESYSDGEILLAEQEGKIVGALMMRRPGKVHLEFKEEFLALDQYKCSKDKIGYIIYAAVDKSYQGQGIGKLLVKEGLKLQKEWGAGAVGVHAWQSSPENASQRLFEKAGFKPVKMHKSIWKDFSKKVGPKKYWCVVCGNPCKCDDLEMVKYL